MPWQMISLTELRRVMITNKIASMTSKRATRLGELAVVQGRGVAVALNAGLVHNAIKLVGGDPNSHSLGCLVQDFPAKLACHAHLLNLLRLERPNQALCAHGALRLGIARLPVLGLLNGVRDRPPGSLWPRALRAGECEARPGDGLWRGRLVDGLVGGPRALETVLSQKRR